MPSHGTGARPRARTKILRTATAGALALAVALGGTTAWAQDTEPTTPPPTTETVTPTDTATPTESPTPTETPTSSDTPSATPSETPSTTTEPSAPAETKPAEQAPEIPAEKKAEVFEDELDAQAAPPLPDLRVTAAFDRAEYEVDADIKIRVTVENVGKVTATDVRLRESSGWLELRSGGPELHQVPGPQLVPGERRTYDLVARQVADSGSNDLLFQIETWYGPQRYPLVDANPNDNYFQARARVLRERGSVDVVVFNDDNGNRQADEGERRSGVQLFAYGETDTKRLSGTSGADGTIKWTGATTGHYRIRTNYPEPRVPAPGFAEFDVVANQTRTVLVPLVNPVSQVIEPTVEFLDDPYVNAGDPVKVKITVKNAGTQPLSGVVAVCGTFSNVPGLPGTGPSWAPLNPDGPGLTLAAGETKTLTVTDVVPQAAYDEGWVQVNCEFGDNGRNTQGYRGASDTADVNGRYGTVEGTLVLDEGDTERPLDATIVALDQRSGLAVDRAYADADGRWRMARVVSGPTKFLVLGEFQPEDGAEFVVDVPRGGVARPAFRVKAGPKVEEPRWSPKLEVTASFDKAVYDVRDVWTARIKVANTGTLGSTSAHWYEDYGTASGLEYDRGQFAPLRGDRGYGVELWPGEFVELTVTGTISPYLGGDTVRLKGSVGSGPPGGTNPTVDLTAKVAFQTGDAEFLVYGDANGNGAFDQGEALPDLEVSLYGGVPSRSLSGKTDGSGRYRATGTTAGTHEVRIGTRDTGWAVPLDFYNKLVVEGGKTTTVEIGLVRPLSNTLTASLEFDKERYHKDEKIDVKLTFTNTGPDVLVKVFCAGELGIPTNGPEWGPFADNGPGVVVPSGATSEFHVLTAIPEYAAKSGVVGLGCEFGPVRGDGLPSAHDIAAVTGEVWTTKGQVLTGEYPYQPVPGVKVVLLDHFTDEPVAQAVADDSGAFTFPDLAVGWYTPVVVGPWKVRVNRQLPLFQVVSGSTYPQNVYVDPGPEVADPWPPTTPGVPTVPGDPNAAAGTGGQAQTGTRLADTGASVITLGLLGLLVLALGFVAVVTGRRRTA
ncbi:MULTISPECIES: carboxypeptidase-like regulatory domain-containing protein [unclassified Saccharothrix]|uniref:carboxypeptidase-like regulatory domain-containing protein n=1 Tax=unclassified Saccharothrix TaxID=2593673 RepID=UPI00307E62D5